MNIATYSKEPDAVTTYEIDWETWLDGRTISTSTWDVPAGITEDASANTTTAATIQLSGGSWAERFVVTNHIVTNTGDEEDRSITVKIQQYVAYCTPADLRQVATQLTATSQHQPATDAILEEVIERASRFFDRCCGVPEGYFNPPLYPIVTTQTVYGDGGYFLKLPPYVSGTLDTDLTLPDGYTAPTFIEREGYLVMASNGLMVNRISPFPAPWSSGWFTGVPITVTAQWGFEETPSDVKMAVIELAINLWRETDPAHLKLVSIDNQPLRENLPPRVREVAKRYRSIGVAFV